METKMRTAMMVAALATALGSQVARADEPTPTNPPAAPAEAPPAAPSHDAAPTPPPAAPGPTVEAAPAAVVVAPAPAEASRPEGFSIGIGAGYTLPASLDRPDTFSARFRLATGLAIEPFFDVLAASRDTSDSFGGIDSDATDKINRYGLGANVRIPALSRGRFDLVALLGAPLSYSKNDPEGDHNHTSQTTLVTSWGLAVDWWLTPHLAISASALNPLVTYTNSESEMGTDETTSQSITLLELAFSPRVTLMAHLYF
jgi:hypothetical protein